MMMICDNDVLNFERLVKGSTETYLTLLEAKVRELELSTPKTPDPVQNVKRR